MAKRLERARQAQLAAQAAEAGQDEAAALQAAALNLFGPPAGELTRAGAGAGGDGADSLGGLGSLGSPDGEPSEGQ